MVRDAIGANPVVLIAFPTNVGTSTAGSRILAATSSFSSATNPAVTPDFLLTHAIPASYLEAGTLTYEDNVGSVLWRLSWGGASYTGTGAGALTNDADGNFSPPFVGPLPSASGKALLFKFLASAASTNNANDYALTVGSATFTNNAGASGTVVSLAGVESGASGDLLALSLPRPNPVRQSLAYSVVLPRAARVQVRVLDLGGRIVRSLVDETLQAGRHGFAWAATADGGSVLASGVYFLEMNAEGTRMMQRFVLLR